MNELRIRIGIDVGGTFTHAVAVDGRDYKVVAHAVTPTTHDSKAGVAEGILTAFRALLDKLNVPMENIVFVAHSTTQATNALLEGDVVPAGIIGMGKGLEAVKAKRDTAIGDIELAPGKVLRTHAVFFNTASPDFGEEAISKAISELREAGCRAIVASEAFGVDDPTNEKKVVELAGAQGLPGCGSHEVTSLYGLRVRTRTAVVNASILPKMIETAEMTEKSVRASGLAVPLMIMRSDGGVMNTAEVRKRPILTLLSGPAAGIAAALMFARVSDGVFLEVGGTSTDISVIKNGRAMIKTARIGGHLTYLKTLDSRTVGVAGGSMIRVRDGQVFDTGPRSAHIAGMPYAAFSREEDLESARPVLVRPREGDPADYLVLEDNKGKRIALTLTDAAMFAGFVKEGDYAYGNPRAVQKAFEVVGGFLGMPPEEVALRILDRAAAKVEGVVRELLAEYQLDSSLIRLVGGGGGATALVPYVSAKLNIPYSITERAEVVSAIGAALAMMRDYVERTIVDPTEQDVDSVRKEAEDRLIRMGADPRTVEVQIEIDKQRNVVRAIATGANEMRARDLSAESLIPVEKAIEIACRSMKADPKDAEVAVDTGSLWVIEAARVRRGLLGLGGRREIDVRVVDREGVVKLQANSCHVMATAAGRVFEDLERIFQVATTYSDGGSAAPQVFVVYGRRIVDLSTVLDRDHIVSILKVELKGLDPGEKVGIIARSRR